MKLSLTLTSTVIILDGSSTNSSAAMANAITWDATIPFEPSSLKTNLDALMVTLNAVHDKDVFEYKIDGQSYYFLSERWWRIEYRWICNT